MTTEKLAEWMARPLGDFDIWAVFTVSGGLDEMLTILRRLRTVGKSGSARWIKAFDQIVRQRPFFRKLFGIL
jgi:hypothetical protein